MLDDGKKRSSESDIIYKLRLQRINEIKKICHGSSFQLLKNRKMRNKLVHVDEHLANYFIKDKAPQILDLTISSRNAIKLPEKATYFRVYVIEEDIILFLDEKLILKDIRKSAMEIIEKLKKAGY